MEVIEQRCDECGRPPRRLALTVDGLLFCSRDCYLARHSRIWDKLFFSAFARPKDSPPAATRPAVSMPVTRDLRIV